MLQCATYVWSQHLSCSAVRICFADTQCPAAAISLFSQLKRNCLFFKDFTTWRMCLIHSRHFFSYVMASGLPVCSDIIAMQHSECTYNCIWVDVCIGTLLIWIWTVSWGVCAIEDATASLLTRVIILSATRSRVIVLWASRSIELIYIRLSTQPLEPDYTWHGTWKLLKIDSAVKFWSPRLQS